MAQSLLLQLKTNKRDLMEGEKKKNSDAATMTKVQLEAAIDKAVRYPHKHFHKGRLIVRIPNRLINGSLELHFYHCGGIGISLLLTFHKIPFIRFKL